jgi:hypothetical protein
VRASTIFYTEGVTPLAAKKWYNAVGVTLYFHARTPGCAAARRPRALEFNAFGVKASAIALSPDGNPEFATVLKVVESLGLKLHATAGN